MARKQLAWRVILAATAVYVVTSGFVAVRYSPPSGFGDALALFGVRLGLFVLYYWFFVVLVLLKYNDEQRHNWHVWTAWLCTTGLFVWILVLGGELEFILSLAILWWPPLAALVGLIIGEIGFRLKSGQRFMMVAAAVVAIAVVYKTFNTKEPTPVAIEKRTNATIRTGSMKAAFEIKSVAGCHDPADTFLWIEIATIGKRHEHPANMADFTAQYFHECGFYIVATREFVEEIPAVTFGGVDMVCIKDFFNQHKCHWIPAFAIELDTPGSDQR